MQKTVIEDFHMLINVAAFGAKYVGMFPKHTAGKEIVDLLDSTVVELANQSSAQVSAETALRISRNARNAARNALRIRLRLADNVARALNSDKFRATRGRTNRALIDSGRAFVVAMESLKKEFAQHSLSLEEMTAAVQALEQALLDYSAGKANRRATIQLFRKTLADGMGFMRRLEALVTLNLADDTAAMASWTVARTVVRARTRRAARTAPTPVAVESPPVPIALSVSGVTPPSIRFPAPRSRPV